MTRKEKIVEKAVNHPEEAYKKPSDVLKDRQLKDKDKIRILDSWEQDEEAMARAEDENMTRTADEPAHDEMLRRIHTARHKLEEDEPE